VAFDVVGVGVPLVAGAVALETSSGTLHAGTGLRLVRGGLIAAATLGVAVWAHRSADGNVPGPAGLAVLWALSTVVAAALLARPASVRRLVVLLCAGQGVLHLLLSIVSGHGQRPAPTSSASYYASHSMLAGSEAPSAHGSAADLTQGLGGLLGEVTTPSGLLMLATHLVAAAIVGLWLAAGEKALWSALTGIAAAVSAGISDLLRLLVSSPTPAASGPRPVPFPDPPSGLGRDRLVRCPRRGPPGRSSGRPW
jgi:hypothetical protein